MRKKTYLTVSIALGMILAFGPFAGVMNAVFPPPDVAPSSEIHFWDDVEGASSTKWNIMSSPGNIFETACTAAPQLSEHQTWFLRDFCIFSMISLRPGYAAAQSMNFEIQGSYVTTFYFGIAESLGVFKMIDDGFIVLRMNGNMLETFDGLVYHPILPLAIGVNNLVELRADPEIQVFDLYLEEVFVGSFPFASSDHAGRLTIGDYSMDSGTIGNAWWNMFIVSALHEGDHVIDFESGSIASFTTVTWALSLFDVEPSTHSPFVLHMQNTIANASYPYPAIAYGFSEYFDTPTGVDYVMTLDFMIPDPYNLNVTVISDGSAVLYVTGNELFAKTGILSNTYVTTLVPGIWYDDITIHVHPSLNLYEVGILGFVYGPFDFAPDQAYRRPSSQFFMGSMWDWNQWGMSYGEAYWDNIEIEYVRGSKFDMKINEVMFEPSTGEQWMELRNTGPFGIDIRGWELTDEDGFNYAFPDRIPVVPSDGYIALHLTYGVDDLYFGQSQFSALNLYAGDGAWGRFQIHDLPFALAVGAANFDPTDDDIEVVVGNSHCCCAPSLYLDVSMYKHSGDPKASWSKNTIDRSSCHDPDTPDSLKMALGDIDDDGRIDVVVVGDNYNQVVWYANILTGWEKFVVDTYALPTRLQDVDVADIDKDDYLDIVVQTLYETVWYRNDGSYDVGNWDRFTLTSNTKGFMSTGDLNGDALVDVVATFTDSIRWLKNDGGYENWPSIKIEDGLGGSQPPEFEFSIADISGDSVPDDVVAVGGSYYGGAGVYWYKNEGGSGNNWIKETIDHLSHKVGEVQTGDINHDGRTDVLITLRLEKDVIWFENLGGSPLAWEKHYVDNDLSPVGQKGPDLADIDMDGLIDVVVTDRGLGEIYWYTRRILEIEDQLSLYIGSEHAPGTLVDFVAWGGDALGDDDIAVAAGQWTDGDYVPTTGISPDWSIGRDASSTDTDSSLDWTIQIPTQGAPNI